MIRRLVFLAGLLAIVALACSAGSPGPGPTPTPTPTASATSSPGPAPSLPELKLALVDAYGPLWYCDPDFYPVARGEEIDHARARWAEVLADVAAFRAIATHLGIDRAGSFTDAQKLAIYRQWKVLGAIALDPAGNGSYRFDYLAQPAPGGTQGIRTGGTIDATGAIRVEQQAPASEPMCPICLARGTSIETPGGGVAVEDLRFGDPVWTVGSDGHRVAGTVIATASTVAPANHHVVHLVLADGRTVTASPGHPLADGRLLGDLRPGDLVDGSAVIAADLVPYHGGETFDLVVSGPSGIYLVDGIELGSTIR